MLHSFAVHLTGRCCISYVTSCGTQGVAPRVICALHGLETQLHVYEYPERNLVQKIVGKLISRQTVLFRARFFQAAIFTISSRFRRQR